MKILFDTNILISAFLTGGSSYEVMEQAIHQYDIYYTTFIINEFKEIFKNKFHYPESVIDEFVLFIHKFFLKGNTANNIPNICRDPDDNQVLADAVINGIDVIITGDRDLLELNNYKGIKIIFPIDYWNL